MPEKNDATENRAGSQRFDDRSTFIHGMPIAFFGVKARQHVDIVALLLRSARRIKRAQIAMSTCSVRWRPSGGRGEFEFVPATSLEGRDISVLIEPHGVTVRAEVRGLRVQGKPRLRKHDSNNRQKLHLPQLVMAIARLPDPAREDTTGTVKFPLEDKQFLIDDMTFDIIEDDGSSVVLQPLRVGVLHSDVVIDLIDRMDAIAKDTDDIEKIRVRSPELAEALEDHLRAVATGTNSIRIRQAADRVVAIQSREFGKTNSASISLIIETEKQPQTDIEEEHSGLEGRLLVRTHVYKERDKSLAKIARRNFKARHGRIFCEVCEVEPTDKYGPDGERCIDVHHKIPIYQLLPDSVTKISDLALVCSNCHRVIHAKVPCQSIEEARLVVKRA